MLTHYGPWHVRDITNSFLEWRRQSIVLDGYIDLDHDEWRATDLLGIDARSGTARRSMPPGMGSTSTSAGAAPGGRSRGALGLPRYEDGAGTATMMDGTALPAGLYADQAVEIRGPDDGSLWTWNGSTWTKGALTFASGPSGDTEARVPWPATPANTQPLNLVAFALPPEADRP